MTRSSPHRPVIRLARSAFSLLWCTSALLLLAGPTEVAAQATSRAGGSTADAALKAKDFSASGLANETLYRSIYSGRFVNVPFDRDEMEFAAIFSAYVDSFSDQCSAHLPSDKIRLTRQECATERVTRNGWGAEISRSCVEWRTVPTNTFAAPAMYRAKQELDRLQTRDALKSVFELLEGNVFSNTAGLISSVQEIKSDMYGIVQMNACDSPELKRFEDNLRRFAMNERPIRLAGSDDPSSVASQRAGALAADHNFAPFMEDLIGDQSESWLVNRFVRGSVSGVSVQSRDPRGRPSRVVARYAYIGLNDDRGSGSVTLTFEDGWPKCLYFFDDRTTCRTPNRRIVAAYADGEYAKPTPQQLAQEERRVYERAKSLRSLSAVDTYLTEYGPSGTYAGEVRAIKDELARDAFRAAKDANTLHAYEQYLRDYPGGADVKLARAEVERFDAAAYESARASGTIEAYRSYLRQFPSGRHATQAQDAITEIERDAFDMARRSGTAAAYQEYLQAYPSGRYAQQARSLVGLTRQLDETERQIEEQRRLQSAASRRATLYTATSVAALAGAGALGYFAYREYEVVSDRQTELNDLESGTPAHDDVKSDMESHAKTMALLGAGSLAVLYLARKIAGKRTVHSREARQIGNQVKELEAERDRHRQNIRQINERSLTLVPHINHRLEPGLSLTLRF